MWVYVRGVGAGAARSRSGQEELPHVQDQGQWLRGATPTSKVKSGGCEETPHVQSKGNPSKMAGAERGHQRADKLKPQSQTTSQSDHMDHSLV